MAPLGHAHLARQRFQSDSLAEGGVVTPITSVQAVLFRRHAHSQRIAARNALHRGQIFEGRAMHDFELASGKRPLQLPRLTVR